MVVVRSVPTWVRQPIGVLAGVEEFLTEVFGETSSPEALAGRASLAWVGGLSLNSPLSAVPEGPSQGRAIAEFRVANAVAERWPYPDAGWWAAQGAGLDRVLHPRWWSVWTSYGSCHSYALGVSVTIGWAFGVIEDAVMMTPAHFEDGSKIPDAQRLEYAKSLRRIAGPPLKVRPAPGSSRVPDSGGRAGQASL